MASAQQKIFISIDGEHRQRKDAMKLILIFSSHLAYDGCYQKKAIACIKGIDSWDFDGICMILSYSLDVRQLPLDILFSILMFSNYNYIIYYFVSAYTKHIPTLGKMVYFLFYFHTIPHTGFLSNVINF
jgi:hypothetical protein